MWGGQFLGRLLHQQAYFPVACMIAQRDSGAIGTANTAVSAQDQNFFTPEFGGIPSHARVLSPAEQVPRRGVREASEGVIGTLP